MAAAMRCSALPRGSYGMQDKYVYRNFWETFLRLIQGNKIVMQYEGKFTTLTNYDSQLIIDS
ncbi:hypothetical protein IEQ34_004836 [Dendrobium chrysotoxum]|uniref:Uncharacterized protein n=1 Tax=Dendrobium chrysotoxum TaxID=161865 RepID=A0AAV7HB84_DENCH|nr:hypothetical protein IEQ34_004836 [Dendrobium chrysotoxum]